MTYHGVVATAAASLLGATALWSALILRDRSREISLQRLLLLVVLIAIVCRLSFCALTPTFYAPDEESHFNYVRYLYENGSFPVQASVTDAPTNEWEYYQPPLYYLCLTPIYSVLRAVSDDLGVQVLALRLFSILLWAVNVLFVLKIVQSLHTDDAFSKVFAVGMVCLLPTYVFLSSVINNDNLLITIGGAVLYFLSRKASLGRSILIGILLGLALLTKLTGVVYVFAVAAVFLIAWGRKSLSASAAWSHLMLILILGAAMFAPWALRNLELYGSITAESAANVQMGWPSIFHALYSTQKYVKGSFWSAAGIHNNVAFLPWIGIHVTYFAAIGWLYALLSKRRPIREILEASAGDFLLATTVAIAANLALVVRFGVLYGQGQGRLLFPMLIPVALLTALGIGLLGVTRYSDRAHVHAAAFFVSYALSFTAFCLAMFTRT